MNIMLSFITSLGIGTAQFNEKPKTIAVIDTGFTYSAKTEGVKLCRFGHKNFTQDLELSKIDGITDPVPTDNSGNGHGTNVLGLITKYAGKSNYCVVVIRIYSARTIDDDIQKNLNNALRYVINIKADYVNISMGGRIKNMEEIKITKNYLDNGGTIVAAAGNEKSNLSKKPFYPAMNDKRIIVVGSTESGRVSEYSNYGKQVDRWENGDFQTAFGVKLRGTSQSAAISMGKIIKEKNSLQNVSK